MPPSALLFIASQQLRTQGQNTWIDGSLGDSEWFKLEFKKIRKRFPQYRIAIFYVYCREETVLARAKARGEVTGRFVPEATLRLSVKNTSRSVEVLGPLADFLVKLDNEHRAPVVDLFVDHSHSFAAIKDRFAGQQSSFEFPETHPVLRIMADNEDGGKAVPPCTLNLSADYRKSICNFESSDEAGLHFIPIKSVFRKDIYEEFNAQVKAAKDVANIEAKQTADVMASHWSRMGCHARPASGESQMCKWESLCFTTAEPVNLDWHSREVVGIPVKAEYVSYCEGAVGCDEDSPQRVGLQGCKWVSEGRETLDNILRLMLRGGFIYFDREFQVVGINVVVWHFQGGHVLQFGSRENTQDGALRKQLEDSGRLLRLESTEHYLKHGITKRAWLHPGEFAEAPFGGFFYCTDDDNPDFLFPVMTAD